MSMNMDLTASFDTEEVEHVYLYTCDRTCDNDYEPAKLRVQGKLRIRRNK